ncbi:MAG: DNA polymerase III subunit delta [Chloroflexi bacterium]|nr:DNA polymerase III subunit delta [Chloroflexota bacterium]
MTAAFSSVNKKSLSGHNLFLLVWSDELLLRNALDEILDYFGIRSDMKGLRFKEIAVNKSTKAADIIEISEEIPFFGESRTIHLRDINNLSADEVRILREYLPGMPEYTILILSHKETSRNKKKKKPDAGKTSKTKKKPSVDIKTSWDKYIEGIGGLTINCSISPGRVPGWIDERFARSGLKISKKANDALFLRVGTDMVALENEISKLELFAYGEESVTTEMVEKVVSAYPAAQIYMLTDAITECDFNRAMNIMTEIVQKPDEALLVIGYLFEFVRRMMRLKSMAESGMNTNEIIAATGDSPFRVKNSLRSASRFTPDDLRQFVELLYRADRALKRSKDMRLVLDSLLLRLCRRKDIRKKVKQ